MSYVGILDVLTQGLGIGMLTKRYTENQLILGSLTISSIAFIGNEFKLK
jgi:hypothetical protein